MNNMRILKSVTSVIINIFAVLGLVQAVNLCFKYFTLK